MPSIPVQITLRDLPPSPALEERIRDWVDKLERVSDQILRCEVLVETPHQRHRRGNQYRVRILLSVPGEDVVISRDPGPDESHEDPYVAVRDSFLAARRKLEDHVRKLRGEVKRHAEPQHGRVAYLDAEGEWGWLESADARRVYFHRNSVLGGIAQLALGDEVRFTEEAGEQGPQASSLEPVGDHGRHAMEPS
jgi:ribosome-associated translation inhibitor RaiA